MAPSPGDCSTARSPGSAAGAEQTGHVEHAGFVRRDLSVWAFSQVLDDPCGSGVRPGIAPPEQGACLQV